MREVKKPFLAAGIIAILFILAACGTKSTVSSTPTPSPATTGGSTTPTPTPTVTPTPTATPTPTKVATQTPKATATAKGLPFSEVEFKSGDWAKYQMGTAGGAAAQPQGIMTWKVVEIAFGGTTYEGQEVEMAGSVVVSGSDQGTPIPGYTTPFVSVSLFLTEKGKTVGKSWNVGIWGQQVQCFPGTASGSPEQINTPQGMTFTTDTYKVPEGGKVIKVWKYSADGGEVWLSNEVPTYMVKGTGTFSGGQTAETTNFELLAYGSGAPLSVTSAALEASCK